ncbi:hypothetical protein [Niveibacterium sp.]|uniref:hypothetical protein n=1 Tax=Niveibacterium sp. TaxID=2017444 RepID=UPI0035B23762
MTTKFFHSRSPLSVERQVSVGSIGAVRAGFEGNELIRLADFDQKFPPYLRRPLAMVETFGVRTPRIFTGDGLFVAQNTKLSTIG